MESPIDDPQRRTAPHISSPPPSHQAFKAYGQDYRYAETLHNPFPEAVCSGPSSIPVVAAASDAAAVGVDAGVSCDASGSAAVAAAANTTTIGSLTATTTAHDSHSISSHNDTGMGKESILVRDELVWVEPPEEPWYKNISRRRWLAIIVCTIGITGVVLAILGAMNKLSGESSTTDVPAMTNNNSNETSSSSTMALPISATPSNLLSSTSARTTTSSPTPSNTAPTIDCSSPKTFLTDITWVGTDVGKYKGEFAQASSAEACCRACLRDDDNNSKNIRRRSVEEPSGCAGWLYNATSAFTPCTKIIVVSAGKGKKEGETDDDHGLLCPRGFADATYFTQLHGDEAKGDAKKYAGVAGMGPCSLEMIIQ